MIRRSRVRAGVRLPTVVLALTALAGCASSPAGGGQASLSRGPLTTGDFTGVTCSDWLAWPQDDRVASMLILDKRLNAFDQSVGFARTTAADIATDCRAEPSLPLTQVVAAFATLDAADFP